MLIFQCFAGFSGIRRHEIKCWPSSSNPSPAAKGSDESRSFFLYPGCKKDSNPHSVIPRRLPRRGEPMGTSGSQRTVRSTVPFHLPPFQESHYKSPVQIKPNGALKNGSFCLPRIDRFTGSPARVGRRLYCPP